MSGRVSLAALAPNPAISALAHDRVLSLHHLMNIDNGNSKLVTAKLETGLVSDEQDRIIRQNDPEKSPGPRMLVYGFESGNVFRTRSDVVRDTVAQLVELVASEPTLYNRSSEPIHRDEYVRLLASASPIERHTSGVMFLFPAEYEYSHGVELICSGTPEGDRKIDDLRVDGLPDGLIELGFSAVEEFWKPWCFAMHENRIASVGFTARLGDHGAESGIVTVPDLRGRGFAAAAVSGWARHPDLQNRMRFYSTSNSNTSSQRVAERLGLSFIGTSFVIF